jgi:hypothetical protein
MCTQLRAMHHQTTFNITQFEGRRLERGGQQEQSIGAGVREPELAETVVARPTPTGVLS